MREVELGWLRIDYIIIMSFCKSLTVSWHEVELVEKLNSWHKEG